MRGVILVGRIPRDSWAIIERVIRRYPENKEVYDNEIERLTNSSPQNDGQPKGNSVSNPVENIVLGINAPRMERMRREIEAVESVYNALSTEHQKVIRVRFWSDRYRNMPYLWMERSVSYKEAQMKRITCRFVTNVGKKLGEI